jgi:C-terminal processing protease CtpA/Prc
MKIERGRLRTAPDLQSVGYSPVRLVRTEFDMPRSSSSSRKLSAFLLACLIGTVVPGGKALAQSGAEKQEIENLVGLAKVWAAAKYFHPYLAYRAIDWDKSLVTAIPAVSEARTSQQYGAAIQSMLDALQDPVTRVVSPLTTEPPSSPVASSDSDGARERDPLIRLGQDGVLTVTISNFGDLTDYVGAQTKLQEIGRQSTARAIIFDLRTSTPVTEDSLGNLGYLLDDPAIANQFVSVAITTPVERRRMHAGFVPQNGLTSGSYFSASLLIDGLRIEPGKSARDVPIAFLVNQNSELPRVALALQSSGKAMIVADGRMPGDDAIVATQTIKLPHDLTCKLRLGELVGLGGTDAVRADVTVPASTGKSNDGALEVARSLVLKDRHASPPRSAIPAAPTSPVQDSRYAEMRFPPLEYRLLAAFRIYAVFEYFFPYKDLMGEDWDQVLREFIPRFQLASNETEYALVVAEMLTHTHDSHVSARGPVLNEYFGTAAPPLQVRMIEGVPVVTGSFDEGATTAQGMKSGDIVVAVDGERVEARMARLAKLLSASTPQALSYKIAARLLRGADGSTAVLLVSDGQGQPRQVKLIRRTEFASNDLPERNGEVTRILPGNIGYADLQRLTVTEVDTMFERFKDTNAIIFDMRGYPQGTAWSIAPRISERPTPAAALFRKPVVMASEGDVTEQRTTTQFMQRIPQSEKWKYKRKTVMLIDERTVSQAEHTGLFLRAANGTTFVGSPTNGANGDVTSFFVPGDTRVYFSGQGVRHPDGSQLQRIGLVPDVEVRPTIAGIRAGRDEVLERAVKYANGEHPPAVSRDASR